MSIKGVGGPDEIWKSGFNNPPDRRDLKKIVDDYLYIIQNLAMDPKKAAEYEKAAQNLRDEVAAYLKAFPELPDNPQTQYIRAAFEQMPVILDKWHDRAMENYNAANTLYRLIEEGAPKDQIAEAEAFLNNVGREMDDARQATFKNFEIIDFYYRTS